MHKPIVGISYCLIALLAFALQDVVIKRLSVQLPVLQILSLRTILVLAILIVIGIIRYGPEILRTTAPRPMIYRGLLAFLAFSTYYIALAKIPLADAAAVYMTSPLFVTALSVPLLAERVGLHRGCAILVGFLAVLLILRPGSSVFQLATALPLFSALCYALIPIITRKIGMSQRALTITIYTMASYLSINLIVAAAVHLLPEGNALPAGVLAELVRSWNTPTFAELGLMAVAGVLFTVGLLSITQAYRMAAVSTVAPFEYSYLLWATLLGYVAFGDKPDSTTIIGSLIVVGSGLYIIYRERRKNG